MLDDADLVFPCEEGKGALFAANLADGAGDLGAAEHSGGSVGGAAGGGSISGAAVCAGAGDSGGNVHDEALLLVVELVYC